MYQRLAAQELITERMLLDMISLKHQHVEFGCQLLTNRNPSWEEMLKIAKTADEEAQVRQEIHTKRNTPAIRRINDSYSGEEPYSLGDDSDDSTTVMTDDTEVFFRTRLSGAPRLWGILQAFRWQRKF